MTKAIPLKRLLSEQRDGNQEDAQILEPRRRSKLRLPLQQQPVDWDRRTEPKGCRRTSLEQLLDLELDLDLIQSADSAPASNQVSLCSIGDDQEPDVESVSLELLAMQSPHGENQHWQSDGEEENCVVASSNLACMESLAPEEHSPSRRKEVVELRKNMRLGLMSPTEYIPCFPPSPTLPNRGNDYDLASPKALPTTGDYGLASPMALPDTPSQSRSGIKLEWDLAPRSPSSNNTNNSPRTRLQSMSVQKAERPQRPSGAKRAATPNPRNRKSFAAPDRVNMRVTRRSLPSLPEGRSKARHGGIYSLLLKNKTAEQEPTLLEDALGSEDIIPAPSISKQVQLKNEVSPMNRIFGAKKKQPEAPPVNISDVGGKVDARVTDLDMKIEKLNEELRKYQAQMKKARGPALNSIKQRAMQTLKRKKMFEDQRDKLMAQSFNIDQKLTHAVLLKAAFAIDTSRDTISTVAAMKSAAVQLKAETQKIDISELEDVQDDMADLMEDMNEIQEIMGRSYGPCFVAAFVESSIGDEVDESELEAELAGLEEEWAEEEANELEVEQTPSYLAPTQQHELPAAPSGTLDSGRIVRATDDFGLPVASTPY